MQFRIAKKIVELSLNLWYNPPVVLPIPDNRRRCVNGSCHFFFNHCNGWCSLPLHHQMVRQWPQRQQLTYWVLCQYKRKEESPDCTPLRFGDSFLASHGLVISFLPTGIIAYAIPNCNIHRKFLLNVCGKCDIVLSEKGSTHSKVETPK